MGWREGGRGDGGSFLITYPVVLLFEMYVLIACDSR